MPFKLLTDFDNTKTLLFSLKKKGLEVQRGDSDNMLFYFDSIIEHITRYFYLNEGDLIFTGTPEGVGSCVAGDEPESFLVTTDCSKL